MRKLLFLMVALVALWSGYWFVGSNAIRDGVEGWFADASRQGMVAENSGVTVAGFPNRFDLTIDGLKLADPVSGAAWEAPFVQVFAMTWKPWHVIAAFPPDQVVTLPDQVLTVNSADLLASLRVRPSTDLPLAVARLAGNTLLLGSDRGWSLELGDFTLSLSAHQPLGPAGYEFAFELAPLTPDPAFVAAVNAVTLPDLPRADLPEVLENLRGSIYLSLSAPLDRHAGEARPFLRRIEINRLNLTWGALAVSGSGVVEADGNGFAAGRLALEVTNWDRLPALLVASGVVAPGVAPTIARGLQGLTAQSTDPRVLTLPLVLEDGWMRFGPFPLGPAPLMVPAAG
jgi:hypothetical protein